MIGFRSRAVTLLARTILIWLALATSVFTISAICYFGGPLGAAALLLLAVSILIAVR